MATLPELLAQLESVEQQIATVKAGAEAMRVSANEHAIEASDLRAEAEVAQAESLRLTSYADQADEQVATLEVQKADIEAQIAALEPVPPLFPGELPVIVGPAPESYRVWPNLVVRGGPSSLNFNSTVRLRWKNVNGDWLDKNGQEQGPVPWYLLTVPPASAGYIEFDITELAQRWHTVANKGMIMLPSPSINAAADVSWCGTYGENPPQLVVSRDGQADVTMTGDLCGFAISKLTASSAPSSLDTSLSASMNPQRRQCLHFHELSSLDGTVTKAVLRMHANSSDPKYPMMIDAYETDAPALLLGGAGGEPVYGLSAEVGEENLHGHTDVIAAGDMREENWNATPGVWKDQSLGRGKLFTSTTMSRPQYQKTQVISDPEMPGRYYLRTCIATGQIGGGQFMRFWHKSGPAETGRMPDPDTYEGEVYSRCEIWLEPDSFWSRMYAFKFSPVGYAMHYGKGEDGGKWNGDSIWIWGSGQSSSDGRRQWSEEHQQWILKGHSIRGHMLGHIHPDYGNTHNAIALGIAPSHLGPYDTLRDGGLYGTEQNLRIGERGRDHCIPMGRWVTIESHVKVNTIDMSVLDDQGNGVARNDGVFEMWLDGVLVGGRYNLAWMRHPSMGVQGTWTMAYHGGNTKTDHDIWWRIRNPVIARRHIGPRKRKG
jgi:hypothetical protein